MDANALLVVEGAHCDQCDYAATHPGMLVAADVVRDGVDCGRCKLAGRSGRLLFAIRAARQDENAPPVTAIFTGECPYPTIVS
jgi:hypothetical protein